MPNTPRYSGPDRRTEISDIDNHPTILAIHAQLAAGGQRMTRIEESNAEIKESIRENTELTREVKGWLEAGSKGLQLLAAMGKVSKYVAAIVTMIGAIVGMTKLFMFGGKQ